MQQQQLFTKIFNKASNETEAKSFLDSVLNEHPYFGLAQFYLLKNTDSSTTQYTEVAAKTSLFFNDAFFLNGQLLATEIVSPYIPQQTAEAEYEIRQEKNNEIENNDINNAEIEDSLKLETINIENKAAIIDAEKDPTEFKEVKENVVDESQMLFEPLHASDYFASQGIKLSEDALANDKLGKQLKSFTAWLKTMKKVHSDKLPAVTAIIETAVQTQAEKSNIEEEIVTEPMAEAYVQQHKYVKAIEIYSKLSLLNPAKSAYFAAKIDSLKK